jgi:hypothetical protein
MSLLDYNHHIHVSLSGLSTTHYINYSLLRYNKANVSYENIDTLGLYRSVIIHTETNKVVCVSPPKSVSPQWFMDTYSDLKDVYAEEFVEGTMVNAFWDSIQSKWVVSTKGNLGATTTFYTSQTFLSMFTDACNFCNLQLDNLEKTLCYSFVLQHPNNRIVVAFRHPTIYLVRAYRIHPGNQVELIELPSTNYSFRQDFVGFEHSSVQVPTRYTFHSYAELESRFAQLSVTPYNVLGVVIRHHHHHCKIRNPTYLKVRDLRGVSSRLDYNYLRLRKIDKVSEFLLYFPEYKHDMSTIRRMLHTFTGQLYLNYVACYIYKQNNLGYFNAVYQRHMKQIHYIYLTHLKNNNKSINKYIVIEYVNGLDIKLQLQAINSITTTI